LSVANAVRGRMVQRMGLKQEGAHIMDCRKIEFSSEKSNERMDRAAHVFEPAVLFRILAFALHVFGAKRKVIAELVGMPEESVKTTVRVVGRDGFQAFLDRRRAQHLSMPRDGAHSDKSTVRVEGETIVVDLNSAIGSLRIPLAHRIQLRTVLLSLMNSGLLSTHETASALGISGAHCRQLARKLAYGDVAESLIDKRVGQQQDFKVGPTEKAEIIRQFAARAVTGHSTASDVIAEQVNNLTQASLTSRTIRWHMSKFGLTSIKNTLPELAKELKQTPDAAC